ncbi:acyl-CoA N-acyltransferase [Dissophora ornata]|nr:hypothetical protein BGZ58_008312 [Dissophora ornata]KAI8602152.1 acyl-CoA N-acyltransferase [Dissophora ornata]
MLDAIVSQPETIHVADTVDEQETTSTRPIRCVGPYKVTDSIWLTPIWLSDSPELCRVLNINKTISEGLYSSKMTFPFPEAEAIYFAKRHLRKRVETGVNASWAIRTSTGGPMIGLLAMDAFDHGDNIGPCYDEAGSRSAGEVLRCGGLGYWISPEYSGKGIMSQVVAYAVEAMAWQEFGYERVHGEAWVENMGSRRVMEHAGMRRTAGEPCFVAKFNATKDVAHYIVDVPKE